MSLLNLFKEHTQGFNPATDTASSSSEIPAGEYDVVVDKAGYRCYESGYDAIAITARVVTGEQVDRQELININVDPDYPVNSQYPGLYKQNLQLINQFIYVTDTELTEDDWEDQMTLGAAFTRQAIGKQFLLDITETTSKKGKTYRNYKFTKYDEDTLTQNDIDLTEDDIPF
ncbi:DUF669 domain-containing protein [Hutsoniella sourekii]|uniref:DUF669 domain-containing protein n=1 Tax=Hutsoniella sourekii TaxID=87650 RepID=UPI000481B4B2|nr:DUF669 domain-containing protein [Hutsoniella sourekii]